MTETIVQKWIREECWIASCQLPTSHVLETRVLPRPDTEVPTFTQHTGYCEWDAGTMAIALVRTYDYEYEILNIRPVEESDFGDDNELHDALLS